MSWIAMGPNNALLATSVGGGYETTLTLLLLLPLFAGMAMTAYHGSRWARNDGRDELSVEWASAPPAQRRRRTQIRRRRVRRPAPPILTPLRARARSLSC